MYPQIKSIHSGLAYILLAALAFSIIYTLILYSRKSPFTDTNRKIALLGLVSAHLQLVFGLIIYFISPLGMNNLSGAAMKHSISRLYAVEHPLTMIIAIALITVGYSRSKRSLEDRKKYSTILVYYTLGLFLILLRIPWQIWP